MIHIDASHLEGGGQSPRLALCLSALTLTPVHLTNIRANRASYSSRPSQQSKAAGAKSKSSAKPPTSHRVEGGLKESHLAALTFLAEACNAKVTGAEVGSREVVFKPRRGWYLTSPLSLGSHKGEKAGTRIELKNPGSVFLIFQALYPYLVFAQRQSVMPGQGQIRADSDRDAECETKTEPDSYNGGKTSIPFEVTLVGGTNVDKSMSLDYVQQVFLPICKKIGLPVVEVNCIKRGWAGHAGEVGEVNITVDLPVPRVASDDGDERLSREFSLAGFCIEERGDIEKVVINVLTYTKELRESVLSKAREKLTSALGSAVNVVVNVDDNSGHASRFYILLVVHTSLGWRLGRDFLGSGRKARNDKEADTMVDKAVTKVVGDLILEIEGGGCVDEHMQDQLVVFQALAQGRSTVKGKDGKGSLHTQTARWVCEQILGERGVAFNVDGGCEGIGWSVGDVAVAELAKEMQELEINDHEEYDQENAS